MKTTRTTARRRLSKQVPGAETPHAPVVIDIDGLSLDADDRRRLRHPLTGGLILFARNWQDRHQLTELTATASNATKCHAMQACDRAANAAYRAATAEQSHDETTRQRNMAMYRTNIDRAREIIRANK